MESLDSASSCERNSGHSRWLSIASASRSSPPGSCSAAAASMPVAARLVPPPASLAVEHGDGQAAAREPPRDRQADDAGADHGDVDARGKARLRPLSAAVARRLQPLADRDGVVGTAGHRHLRLLSAERLEFDDRRALEIQSLRRYEPDQVRRISALTSSSAAAQRFLSPLSGISLEWMKSEPTGESTSIDTLIERSDWRLWQLCPSSSADQRES